ncbi:MAG: helix-turn-helix domain-containing protein [Candidatus Cryptobacteroides sp.]
MEKDDVKLQERLRKNIRKLMTDRDLPQRTIADYMGTTASQFSRILKGECNVTLKHISNLASSLSLREIDIFTYPDVYVQSQTIVQHPEPVEAILQIKLQKEKKDQVLKLIFGDRNIEILNE